MEGAGPAVTVPYIIGNSVQVGSENSISTEGSVLGAGQLRGHLHVPFPPWASVSSVQRGWGWPSSEHLPTL